jgi:hypothetical protein
MEPSRSGVARGVGGRGTGRDGAYGSEATGAAIWGWVWVVKASERSTLGPSRRGRPRPRRFRAAGEGPLSLSLRGRDLLFVRSSPRGIACANCTQEEGNDQGGDHNDQDKEYEQDPRLPHPRVHQAIQRDHPVNSILGDIRKGVTTRSRVAHFCEHYSFMSSIEPYRVEDALRDSN